MTASPTAAEARELVLPTGPRANEAALDGFDALPPGQSVVIVAEKAPRELLKLLQAERKGIQAS